MRSSYPQLHQCITSTCIRAVSYTHLDVYKRQGFNWSGFHDRDLSGSDYTAQGFYVRLRFKFDENLFSGKSEEVNRTLERTDSAPEIN